MRHQKRTFTFGRKRAARRALFANLAESLLLHEHIVTTRQKARALRTFVEPLITTAKKGRLVDRRAIMKTLYTDTAIDKLINDIGPRYKERSGGYTRITKIGFRPNDGAEKVRIELV